MLSHLLGELPGLALEIQPYFPGVDSGDNNGSVNGSTPTSIMCAYGNGR